MLRQCAVNLRRTMTTLAAVMKKKVKRKRRVRRSPPGATPNVEESSASNNRGHKPTSKQRKRLNWPKLFNRVSLTNKLSKIDRKWSGTSTRNCKRW